MNTSLAQTSQQGAIPDTIDQPRPKGDAVRACIGRQAYETYVDQFCGGDLSFGYSYADPPIIASDGENGPRAHHVFSQSTVPGCRMRHLWLRGGQSLCDVFGPDFTSLRFEPNVDVALRLQRRPNVACRWLWWTGFRRYRRAPAGA